MRSPAEDEHKSANCDLETKATQRVAFRIGGDGNTVFETGLYNLMQDEVPVLVHFGKDKVEHYLLARMEASPAGQESDK